MVSAADAGIALQARSAGGARDITLVTLSTGAADRLGSELAAIEPWTRYAMTGPALASYLRTQEAGAQRYALVVDDVEAGVVAIRRQWLRGPYLQFLGLVPAFQGQGIGQMVLTWFEQGARANDDRNLWVATSDFNISAQRFYQRAGFAPVAHLDGLLRDDIGEILLRKKLCGN